MRTTNYNPSVFETKLVDAISKAMPSIEQNYAGNKIVDFALSGNTDNPGLILKVTDADGDLHELIINVIQRPDTF